MPGSVLVIDNDSQVREWLCAALETDGHTAVGAATYPEAIAQLQWSPVDLAISDGFTAIGLAGVSMLHRLFPDLRLLVMSGGVSAPASIPLSHDTLSILPKPCPIQTVLNTVRHTLANVWDSPLREILERGRLDVLTMMALSSARA
jgi:DNA-binding NtrC family response regulator